MKKITTFLILPFLFFSITLSQTLNIQRVGNDSDVNTSHQQGFLLMGGGVDNTQGLSWFYNLTDIGDVVFLRADEGLGYNDDYNSSIMNSATTIENINSVTRANNPEVEAAVRNAEAVFIVGGDQWNYYNYWKGTLLHDALTYLIHTKGGAIGGTSAGLAVLGELIFTAENNTVFSSEALADPYNNMMTLADDFLNIPILESVITDSHYNRIETDGYDRHGRHFTFIARMAQDWVRNPARGIGVNEVVAVAIESNGIAKIFGDYPNYDDFAYFLTSWTGGPEICQSATPLTWDHSGEAVKVYKVAGTTNGANTFDLNTWQNGNGGDWECWSAVDGVLTETTSCTPPDFGYTFYTLTLEANPTEGGDPTGGGSFTAGTNVQISANPIFGYEFINWTDGTTTVSTEQSFTYTIPERDVTLTANFEATEADIIDGPVYVYWTVCPSASTAEYRDEHYSVYISNTGTNIGDFVQIHDETLSETHTNWDYQPRSVEITEYTGDAVYIAFRHWNSTDNDRISINDVKLYWEDGTKAEVEIFFEDFDTSNGIPAGWTLVDDDGDGLNWYWENFEGDGYLLSDSYKETALTPDNWIITPSIQLGIIPSGYKLTLNSNPTSGGTIINNTGSSNYYEENDTISLTAEANSGYTFINWTIEGIEQSTDPSIFYIMPAEDVTLVANFIESCYTPTYTENFEGLSAIPARWTQNGTLNWEVGSSTNALDAANEPYAYADYTGKTSVSAELITDCFDFTNYTDIRISMMHRFYFNGGGANSAYLDYNINNTTWVEINNWTTSMNAAEVWTSNIIPELAGQNEVKFRWRFVYPNHTGQNKQKNWSIDDIIITGTETSAVLSGDVNDDTFINVLDVVWMVQHINGATPAGFNLAAADVNQDTIVDTSDLVALIDLIYAGAKDFEDNINSEQSYMMLDNDGLVSFDSDGTYSALQFEFISGVNQDMNPDLLLNTDHKLSFNNETGKGIIYSMNNNLIPEGKIDLFSIDGVDTENVEWGFSLAANLNYEAIEIITSKEGQDATSIGDIAYSDLNISVFPNPNKGAFKISISLAVEAEVKIDMFDVLGRKVMTRNTDKLSAGNHLIEVNKNIQKGLYFLRINGYNINGKETIFTKDLKVLIE